VTEAPRPLSVQDPDLLAVLQERFGIPSFRSRQAEAVQGVLDGSDVLLTMPTGAGKSLVYQFPAVVLDGLTLVISPLIALMQDQVDGLVRRGIRATFVNSSIRGSERARRLQAAQRGAYDGSANVLRVDFAGSRGAEAAGQGADPRWQAVLDRLAADAPEDFANWYRRLHLAGCEGGAVRLAAPNAFVSSYVATHLAAPLEAAVAASFGAGARVALVAG